MQFKWIGCGQTCIKSNASELQIDLVFRKEEFGVFLTRVSAWCPSCWPKVLWHTASVTCASKFLFRWLGHPWKQPHEEIKGEGRFSKERQELEGHFHINFLLCSTGEPGKESRRWLCEGLSNVKTCRIKAALGAPWQLWGVGPTGWSLWGVWMVQPLNSTFDTTNWFI